MELNESKISDGSIAVARVLCSHNISLDHLRSVVSPKMDEMRLRCVKILRDHGWGKREAERYVYHV